MPHLHRFVAETPPEPGRPYVLDGEEGRHAARVVRLRPGEQVELIDGAGRAWPAVVAEAGRHAVVLEAGAAAFEAPRAPAIALALAWLHRGKPIEGIVRRAAELGASRVCFFRAARSERAPDPPEKWRRIALECCKQTGRRWAPAFASYPGLDALLEAARAAEPAPRLIAATQAWPPCGAAEAAAVPAMMVLVGPEGDFTDEELAQLQTAGAVALSLGGAVYRSEVAAELALTILRHASGGLGPR